MHVVSLLILLPILQKGLSLMCMQCNLRTLQPFQLDTETAQKCRQGTVQPTKCADPLATHCILSYFTRDSRKNIQERRCGTRRDVTGCSTYYFPPRKSRHLIGAERPKSRRTGDTVVLEVCAVGCEGDNCTVSAAPLILHSYVTAVICTLNFLIFLLRS